MSKVNDEIIIFLDTTNLFVSDLSLKLNSPVRDFCGFRDKNFENLTIVVPKVVVDERVFQNIKFFQENKNKIINSSAKVEEEIGIKLNLKPLDKKGIKEILEKRILSLLKKSKIEKFNCSLNGKEILKRRFLEQKPFVIDNSTNKKKENGLKDTAIWMSFLSFVKKNPDKEIIFVSNNSRDFNREVKDEFLKIFGNELLIFPDLISVEEFLSKRFGLDEQARIQRKIIIEGLIKRFIGDIILKLNQQETGNVYWTSYSTGYSGFRFSDLEDWHILIDDLNEPTIKIRMIVFADESTKEEQPSYVRTTYDQTLGPSYITPAVFPFGHSSSSYMNRNSEKKYVEAELKINLNSESLTEINNLRLDKYSYLF